MRRSGIFLLTGQMEVDREREQPPRHSQHGERCDSLFDSACEVHSGCAVHGFVLMRPILYLRSYVAPAASRQAVRFSLTTAVLIGR